ncbi:TPA: hypothetical protein HA361_04000 [Candidatus Woesearchaeota archaeon]|nr:hypothetical protein [Candidatus Woesearchaeota archaeon]HII68525.1 hypothetical protein [Candidatus Woesearchaeota archaeon]
MKTSREQHLESWAEYVMTHPEWKLRHTRFINALFAKHRNIVRKLRQQEGGEEKMRALGWIR